MRCTFCLGEREESLCWSTLFWPQPLHGLCAKCSAGLVTIEGVRCPGCSRPGSTELCQDCAGWKREHGSALDGNLSVYIYNEHMREMIYKWKYRGDYEVGFSFKYAMRRAFAELDPEVRKGAVIMPIPLSGERLGERGFNQAEMLGGFLPGKHSASLKRIHDEKQSKKSRLERITANNPFNINEKIEKPIILVDDIYTTGATVHKAAEVLKKAGSPRVTSLTLVRG